MDIEKKMGEIGKKINDIKNMPLKNSNRKNYDKVGLVHDLEYLVGQLEYFYDKIMPSQTNMPNTSYYHLKSNPREHQIVYVNLTRGFPKELFGGHYCYIFKKYNDKYIVIPATSVDSPANDPIQDFEIDISVKDLPNNMRLNLANIRGIDLQRIYGNKGIYDVNTDKKYITDEIYKKLFNIV